MFFVFILFDNICFKNKGIRARRFVYSQQQQKWFHIGETVLANCSNLALIEIHMRKEERNAYKPPYNYT